MSNEYQRYIGIWDIRDIYARLPIPSYTIHLKFMCRDPKLMLKNSVSIIEFDIDFTKRNIKFIDMFLEGETDRIFFTYITGDIRMDRNDDGTITVSGRYGIFDIEDNSLLEIRNKASKVIYIS